MTSQIKIHNFDLHGWAIYQSFDMASRIFKMMRWASILQPLYFLCTLLSGSYSIELDVKDSRCVMCKASHGGIN